MILRQAIEKSKLPLLQTFNLMPVHAMGIMHLHWTGLLACRESQAAASKTWLRIRTLDLRIHYPTALDERHQAIFFRHLHVYLQSFASSLECLRLIWLGSEGPSPLTLHLEPDLRDSPDIRPIYWTRLKELWLGNIKNPHQTIRNIPKLTPYVEVAKTLRSTRRDSLVVEANDSAAWLEVMLAQTMRDSTVDSRASSLYSCQSVVSAEPWAGGISRTSKELPIVLDIGR